MIVSAFFCNKKTLKIWIWEGIKVILIRSKDFSLPSLLFVFFRKNKWFWYQHHNRRRYSLVLLSRIKKSHFISNHRGAVSSLLTNFPLFAILSYQTDYFSTLCHNKKVSTGLQEILTMDYVYVCNIHVEFFKRDLWLVSLES